MSRTKVNVRDLVQKIDKVTKERMTGKDVVSLDQFRDYKNKLAAKVILIVEDDPSMQAAMKRIFAMDGIQTRLAGDATELGQVLNEVTPDLIIMDVGLPWVDGFELAEMFSQHRELSQIPLIFVSGQSEQADIDRALKLGARDFIKKPFEVEKLRSVVLAIL